MSRIRRFFLMCSGATVPILEREECLTEHSKYVGIGATVFFTAVLAAASGGYALQKAFSSIGWAIGFGLLWGLMIFNLDRFIVSSIRKRQKDPIAGWRARFGNLWSDLLIAFPRIILAIFFSIIITKPLELGLFEREINTQLNKENLAYQQKADAEVSMTFPEIDRLERDNKTLREETAEKERRKEELRKVMNDEREGRGFTRKFGDGPEYNRYKGQFEELNQEYLRVKDRNDKRIDANDELLKQQRQQKESRTNSAQRLIEERKGLAARISALSNLAKEDIAQRGDYTYYLVDRFIILLFILIEISPILVKMFARFGPYDQIVEESESYAITVAGKNSETRMKIQERLNEELLNSVPDDSQAEWSNTKAEVSRHIIAGWRASELGRPEKTFAARRKQ